MQTTWKQLIWFHLLAPPSLFAAAAVTNNTSDQERWRDDYSRPGVLRVQFSRHRHGRDTSTHYCGLAASSWSFSLCFRSKSNHHDFFLFFLSIFIVVCHCQDPLRKWRVGLEKKLRDQIWEGERVGKSGEEEEETASPPCCFYFHINKKAIFFF
jgi:hypothetical protein